VFTHALDDLGTKDFSRFRFSDLTLFDFLMLLIKLDESALVSEERCRLTMAILYEHVLGIILS